MSTTLSADFRDANPNATVWDIVRALSRFGAVHAMVKSAPVSLDTVWTTMTAVKEAGHEGQDAKADHDSWQ